MSATYGRREFLAKLVKGASATLIVPMLPARSRASVMGNGSHQDNGKLYGMGIQVDKCIGCGRCVAGCKAENDVPREPYFFRTWVERYVIHTDNKVDVESPEGGINGFDPIEDDRGIMRSFFVPKLCNQCDNPPCVQVCPVGATFKTDDGVILVDKEYCLGCRYCIQACPYGARYLDPRSKTADKCTFCYHRLHRGLLPTCVELCPTQARVFGDMKALNSPLNRMMRMSQLQVLKPSLNTEPKVIYSMLDREVG